MGRFLCLDRLDIAYRQCGPRLPAEQRQQHLDPLAATHAAVDPSEPDERSPHDTHAIAGAHPFLRLPVAIPVAIFLRGG